MVPGKYGQLEWCGAEVDGSERVYVFSDRRNVVPRLRAVPGLHACQTGDSEARFWLPATDAVTLRVVARTIRAYRRRPGASPETLKRARIAAMDALIEGTVRPRNAGMFA